MTPWSPPLDVLVLVADRHRCLQHDLRSLLGSQMPADSDLSRFSEDVVIDEGLKRSLLHPLLARSPDGGFAVARRREEQNLLVHQLARTRDLAGQEEPDPALVATALRDVSRTLIGHTDREELEDFGRLRELTSSEERAELAETFHRLRDGLRPAAAAAVRGMSGPDPLAVLQDEIQRLLGVGP